MTTGCSSQAERISPEASMNKMCNALLYLDEKDLTDLNFSAENIREMYANSFSGNNDDIKITDEQKNLMADALIDTMRKKIKYDVKTESVNGDKAVVAVTITGINLNESVNEVSFDATGLTEQQISDILTQKIIEKIENVPSRKPITIKFNCEFSEDANLWIPEGNSENNLTPIFDAALN